MMAAANPRRLADVDEVVVLVTEGQFGQVVVVHNGIGIGPLGGQTAMLGPRYNRSNFLEAAKNTLRCSGTTSMVLTRCKTCSTSFSM